MSRVRDSALLALAAALISGPVRAATAPGFVPFDPAARVQVSGAHLMIAAYAVVCGLVALYALSLYLRTRALRSRARRLEGTLLGGTGRAGPK
jgi:hypothetical protein